jgi:hypothetical protein
MEKLYYRFLVLINNNVDTAQSIQINSSRQVTAGTDDHDSSSVVGESSIVKVYIEITTERGDCQIYRNAGWQIPVS